MHRRSGFARFQRPAPDCDPPDWILTLGTVGARRLAGIVPGMKLGEVPWESGMGQPWLELVSEALATGREMRVARSPVSAATWHALELHSPDTGCLDLIFSPPCESVEQERLVESLRAHERMLVGEKMLLAVTLRSIGDAVVTTDRDGLVTMLNNVAEDLTGWSSSDAVGQKLSAVFAILDEWTREPREDPFAKVVETGKIVLLPRHTLLVARDGREVSIADSAAPILDDSGTLLGVVLVFRDMTERHRLVEEMNRVQSMDSIGILASGIAHDFNNLLTGIFGNLILARESIAASRPLEAQDHLSRALEVFDRTKALTQQLLTFAKGGKPVRKMQGIGTLVRNSAQFALSGSDLSATFGIADDLWRCDCDGNQIGQVVDNLVLNAKQASPGGGKVDVWASNRILEPGAERVASHHGNFVEIGIRDNGAGMSPEVLSRIFTPFYSTKATGHGLGLAAVHSIVQKHDGWVEVESECGVGSTFHVFLPADPDSGPDTFHPDSSTDEPFRGAGRILVMDDQDYIASFMCVMLEHLGYAPTATKDGDEAVVEFRRAEDEGEPFRACILDLTIPGGKGGIETAAAIRRIRSDVVLVASSGYSESPVVLEPDGHGFDASLVKPYRMEDLADVLEHAMAQRAPDGSP